MWKAIGGQSKIISEEFCLHSVTIPTKEGAGCLNSATQIYYEIIIKVVVLLLIINLSPLKTQQ